MRGSDEEDLAMVWKRVRSRVLTITGSGRMEEEWLSVEVSMSSLHDKASTGPI